MVHETHHRSLPEEINGGGTAKQQAETKRPRECHLSKRLRSFQFLKWKAQRRVASRTGQTLPRLHEGTGPVWLG